MDKGKLIETVHAAQQGDKDALALLYEEFYEYQLNYAWRLVNNREDALDLVQDSYLIMTDHIKGLREPASYFAWIKRIMYTIMCRKHRKVREYTTISDDVLEVEDTNIEHLPSHRANSTWEKEDMMKKIAHLADNKKEVIYQFYFHQRSLQEIAKREHLSVGTIKSRLFYGKQDLKRFYQMEHKSA